ncbi:MAG: GntR family transcriptional regulator [Thalassobaculaceae bacterium]|nr:GntR family transcriptional regulator [Thalassobaculaceae bacterium]
MAVLPEIVRSPSLSATAKRLVQEAIWSGGLPPGAHLVESQLAEQFQISRGPLREALRSLAAEGLVEIQPGRGAFVVDPTPDEMQDMIVLRAMLGGMAARYITASADEKLFNSLAKTLLVMRSAAEARDERAFFDQHWTFYELMYRSANRFLFRAWQSLHGLIDIYVRRLGRPHLPLADILWHYERFLDLFRAGDPDEAEAVVRSQSLLVGFQVLDRPIPAMLRAYVTRTIEPDGTVVPFIFDSPVTTSKPKTRQRSSA